jgi:hypothetical protein
MQVAKNNIALKYGLNLILSGLFVVLSMVLLLLHFSVLFLFFVSVWGSIMRLCFFGVPEFIFIFYVIFFLSFLTAVCGVSVF